MQSIFFHFSIPGACPGYYTYMNTAINEPFWVVTHFRGLTWIPHLALPTVGPKLIGFPLVLIIFIAAVVYHTRTNLLRKSPLSILFTPLQEHFYQVHPSIKAIKVRGSKEFGFKPTIYEYPISNILTYLFLTLATINLGGMINGTWCATTWFSGTMGVAFIFWAFTALLRLHNYICLFSRSVHLYEGEELLCLAGFFPAGTPLWLAPLMVLIEVLSWFIRFVSMGLRIAGNLVAGHVIMGLIAYAWVQFGHMVLSNITPSGLYSLFLVQLTYTIIMYFEIAVALIQAYVFTLLVSTFLKETHEMH